MTSQHPIISVRGVTKTYWVGEVEVKALQDVSLDVERGDFVVITGRNGAGKSTLMHNIAVLDTPDCGEVIIDGRGRDEDDEQGATKPCAFSSWATSFRSMP